MHYMHTCNLHSRYVDMKLFVGLVGVLFILIAITLYMGVYSFFKLETSPIVLEVVLFLVLAVGMNT